MSSDLIGFTSETRTKISKYDSNHNSNPANLTNEPPTGGGHPGGAAEGGEAEGGLGGDAGQVLQGNRGAIQDQAGRQRAALAAEGHDAGKGNFVLHKETALSYNLTICKDYKIQDYKS